MADIKSLMDDLKLQHTLARFLEKSDLVECVRVCRSWRDTFLPYIWNIVVIDGTDFQDDRQRYPTLEALHKHRHLVQSLEFEFIPWPVSSSPLADLDPSQEELEPDMYSKVEPLIPRLTREQPLSDRFLYDYFVSVDSTFPNLACMTFNMSKHPSSLYWESIVKMVTNNPHVQLIKIECPNPWKDSDGRSDEAGDEEDEEDEDEEMEEYTRAEQEFWELAEQDMPNLLRLELVNYKFTQETGPVFWQVCKSLRQLVLKRCSLLNVIPRFLPGFLSNIEYLELEDIRGEGWPEQAQMQLISYCRNLERIRVRGVTPDVPQIMSVFHQSFVKLLAGAGQRDPWNILLSCLELSNTPIQIGDEYMAGILRAMNYIQKLSVPGSEFSRLSFLALTAPIPLNDGTYDGRYVDLQELNLAGCSNVTSAMILQLLRTAPELRRLNADTILVSQMRSDLLTTGGDDNAEPTTLAPWACKKLRVLRVEFKLDADTLLASSTTTLADSGKDQATLKAEATQQLQDLVFQRLSQFRSLDVLELKGPNHPVLEYGFSFPQPKTRASVREAPDFPLDDQINPALDSGLYRLKTLKRLRCFRIDAKGHKGSLREMAWMLEHWKNLDRLEGPWEWQEGPVVTELKEMMTRNRYTKLV